jgi:hypothetical protein
MSLSTDGKGEDEAYEDATRGFVGRRSGSLFWLPKPRESESAHNRWFERWSVGVRCWFRTSDLSRVKCEFLEVSLPAL